MHIHLIAIWTQDLEKLKSFYETYFGAKAGDILMDGPRRTGDGYYESLVLDPDGNRVEITV